MNQVAVKQVKIAQTAFSKTKLFPIILSIKSNLMLQQFLN